MSANASAKVQTEIWSKCHRIVKTEVKTAVQMTAVQLAKQTPCSSVLLEVFKNVLLYCTYIV